MLSCCHAELGMFPEGGTPGDAGIMRPLQAHCHLGLGALHVQTDRRGPARAALTTAVVLYRAMAMTWWLPQAETALAQLGRD